jgi:long-chain acyl-CoA synthetase
MEERPWLKHYPNGVPANIDPEKYKNLVAFFDDVCEKFNSKHAFECMGAKITFTDLHKKATQLAAYFHFRGLEPGDRIAMMMPNLLQYPIAVFGALKAGLVVVNTNPLYTPREMLHQFESSDCKAIIIAENFAHNLEQILDKTNIKVVITTSIGELIPGLKGAFVDFAVRHIRRMVPSYDISNSVKFKQAIKEGKKLTVKPFDDGPERVILHQYTGGTTGVSKGAMLTNRNMVSNMLQIEAILFQNFDEGKEVALSPLPMYHIFAFAVNSLATMRAGAKCVLVVNARDIGSIVKEFKRHPVGLMTGVNTLFNALNNYKGFDQVDFSSLKVTVAGGMALQDHVATKWEEITGCHLTQGYGLTETSPVASANPVDGSGKLGSIGLPAPSTDMRIVDDEKKPLGVNEVGEIQIKGPQVMKGYYDKPEETDKVISSDGWFSSGDVGRMDEDGYFWIVDRKKDMINVSGFNVYPNEIEEYVARHPKVMECAAIGIPSEKSGEVVKLFIVKKDKSLTHDEIIKFCREGLTGYKVPKEVEFRKTLPKSNVGKILRRELREG